MKKAPQYYEALFYLEFRELTLLKRIILLITFKFQSQNFTAFLGTVSPRVVVLEKSVFGDAANSIF